jgi:hypothetical protein
MILPTKHLQQDKALLKVGADILSELSDGRSASELWESLKRRRAEQALPTLQYDWFVLTLSFLFSINVINLQEGVISRVFQK